MKSLKVVLDRIVKPIAAALDNFFYGTAEAAKLPHLHDHIDIKRYMSFVV